MSNRIGNVVRNEKSYHAMARKDKPTYRKEYRGLTQNQMLYQSALDYSDNGRCWWVKQKLIEVVLRG